MSGDPFRSQASSGSPYAPPASDLIQAPPPGQQPKDEKSRKPLWRVRPTACFAVGYVITVWGLTAWAPLLALVFGFGACPPVSIGILRLSVGKTLRENSLYSKIILFVVGLVGSMTIGAGMTFFFTWLGIFTVQLLPNFDAPHMLHAFAIAATFGLGLWLGLYAIASFCSQFVDLVIKKQS